MASIIFADKNSAVSSLYEKVLSHHGYSVRGCVNGKQVFLEFSKEPAQLVILSMDLGDMDAISVCKKLRSQEESSHMPIIVIENSNGETKIIEALTNGADEFLQTPFEVDDLLGKITDTLKKTMARTQIIDRARRIVHKQSSEQQFFAEKYEVVEELGSGSFSIVYLAMDKENTTEVALKVFNPENYHSLKTSFNSYFLREAYGMSKLDHPNIVKLLDFGKDGESFFLVMEFIRGQSLSKWVNEHGTLGEENLISLGYHLGAGLEYLEQHNIVHRDIKPDNILVTEDGAIKITDFGLSKQQDDSSLTQVHDEFMGTPNFVAPEQIEGILDIDIRCDVYSLGTTLHYCGTNILPFEAATPMEILSKNLSEDLPPIHEVNPRISVELSSIVQGMVTKDRNQRFSPGSVVRELLNLLGTTPNPDLSHC